MCTQSISYEHGTTALRNHLKCVCRHWSRFVGLLTLLFNRRHSDVARVKPVLESMGKNTAVAIAKRAKRERAELTEMEQAATDRLRHATKKPRLGEFVLDAAKKAMLVPNHLMQVPAGGMTTETTEDVRLVAVVVATCHHLFLRACFTDQSCAHRVLGVHFSAVQPRRFLLVSQGTTAACTTVASLVVSDLAAHNTVAESAEFVVHDTTAQEDDHGGG